MNQIAKEYETATATIYQWIKKFEAGGDKVLKSDKIRYKNIRVRKIKKQLSNEEEILVLKK